MSPSENAPEAAPRNPVGSGGILIRDTAISVDYKLRRKAKAMPNLVYDPVNKTWIAKAGVRYGHLKAAGFQIKTA